MRLLRPAVSLAILCSVGCTVYRPREVTVLVRDAETHRPIPGATVDLSNPHTGADPIKSTTGVIGIAKMPFTPTAGEPILIEAAAESYVADSVVAGETAVAAVPPAPFFTPSLPRTPDFTVDLYSAPRFGVELVVPPNYHGLLHVDLSFRDDVPIPARQRVFQFTASPTGEVSGTGPAVLKKVPVSEYTARTVAGTPVGGANDPDGIMLRWLRHEDGKEIFVLGTKEEYDRYHKDSPKDPTAPADNGKKGGKGGRGGGRRGGGGGG
jgi:hypothetical protein